MKYFLDTEFSESQKKPLFSKPINTIELISIGIVAEDGREYYAISKDFDLKAAWNKWQQRTGEGDRNNIEPKHYWLKENVLKPIWKELIDKYLSDTNHIRTQYIYSRLKSEFFCYDSLKTLIEIYGKSNKDIATGILDFIAYNEEEALHPQDWFKMKAKKKYANLFTDVEFYGYYSDYDWVVFCWLFGRMMDLPRGFPMYLKDLKQMIDEKTLSIYPSETMYKNERVIDSFDTKLSCIKAEPNYPKQTNEHNALSDAKWNLELYKFLNTI